MIGFNIVFIIVQNMTIPNSSNQVINKKGFECLLVLLSIKLNRTLAMSHNSNYKVNQCGLSELIICNLPNYPNFNKTIIFHLQFGALSRAMLRFN